MAPHLVNKFSNHLSIIREAVNGDTDLRTNQKLYKKIYKYYKDLGVIFTGDTSVDYDTVLDYLYEDLY